MVPSWVLISAFGSVVKGAIVCSVASVATFTMWATLNGLAGYFPGDNVHRLTGPVRIAAIVLAAVIIIAFLLFCAATSTD